MNLWIVNHRYEYELRHLIGLFFPGEKIEVILDEERSGSWEGIYTQIDAVESGFLVTVKMNINGVFQEQFSIIESENTPEKQVFEEEFGRMFYTMLSTYTGTTPAWGILTGVRPEKFISEARKKKMTDQEILEEFQTRYFISKEKTELLLKTESQQQKILQKYPPNGIDLYVGIPFCPTRCLYCSFVSHDIDRAGKYIPEYMEKLCEEIRYTGAMLKEKQVPLHTIYIGGGTPTTLTPLQLEHLLSTIESSFDLSQLLEYTVEAGRADTITREKLEVLFQYGVNRISINPQSMVPSVLEAVGRPHSPEQVIEAYHMAKEIGFPIVNMDLIAGLHSDTLEGFLHSLEQVLLLDPENITIHTLSVKRASDMVEQGKAIYDTTSGLVGSMLEKAYPLMEQHGYIPYYLYRQKNMRENLENVGFAKPGTENLYNIYMMEELESIVACGAGSVSKLIYPDIPKIDRIFNFKLPYEYIRRFDEILIRKESIQRFLEEN